MIARRILATALIAGLLMSSAYAAKDYYKWVDEDGVTHYSARKPANEKTEKISVSTGLPRDDGSQPMQSTGNNPANQKQGNQNQTAAAAMDTKDPERCEAAKSNLKIITENARIRERQDDGTTRYLSQEEIDERKNRAEQAIEESC